MPIMRRRGKKRRGAHAATNHDARRAHLRECWQLGARHGGQAVLLLLNAVLELDGPDWAEQEEQIENASRHLREARRWVRASKRWPREKRGQK